MKRWPELITEAAYPGNIGFEELGRFYQTATDAQIKQLEVFIKANDWQGFKKHIKKVMGFNLK